MVAAQQITIERAFLKTLLDRITTHPTFVFSVECQRRTDLFLTYPPTHDMEQHGSHCFAGDHSILADRRFIQGRGGRMVLQAAGTLRTMTVKRKTSLEPTKHWRSKGGELRFDPTSRGLYLVYGMYRDQVQDFGTGARYSRHGQHRSWCFIDLLTTTRLRYNGVEYAVEA